MALALALASAPATARHFRQIELARILPACGYRALGPTGREVPSKVYFDLATWRRGT